MIKEFFHDGNTYWVTEGLVNGNALFLEAVDGITNPENQVWGALILDFHQVETLRALLDHLAANNITAAGIYEPYKNALERLSFLTGTVQIEKNA